jgi:undecaprenyl-diphosphatase
LCRRRLLAVFEVIKGVAVAFLPTGTPGLTLYHVVKGYLPGSLLPGGFFLIAFEEGWRHRRNPPDVIQEGCRDRPFSSDCHDPGGSRPASTIIAGLVPGLKRKTIAEFPFPLAVPSMPAATACDLMKTAPEMNLSRFDFLTAGFVASFIAALLDIRFLLRCIPAHRFISFGVYRIVPLPGLRRAWAGSILLGRGPSDPSVLRLRRAKQRPECTHPMESLG